MPPLAASQARIHLPCLVAALIIMLASALYPPFLANAAGRADHLSAGLAFWAMSAGFVRGVGFVPHAILPRWLFSATACLLTLLAFTALRILT
ncbi:cyd operon YbgE family protein [Bradyrhizobium oligotrophicum S58]